MNKIFGYIGVLIIGLVASSCDMGDVPEVGGTKVQAMAGEWFIKVLIDGEDQEIGYNLITTSNTAKNTDTDLLLDDHELLTDYDLPPVKTVCKVNIPTLTFTKSSNLPNLHSGESSISIVEGKVLKNAATTSGGNKTDSIYVKFVFDNDPSIEWEYSGYRRTGFLEDEH